MNFVMGQGVGARLGIGPFGPLEHRWPAIRLIDVRGPHLTDLAAAENPAQRLDQDERRLREQLRVFSWGAAAG
jgi:hypothetical protein